MIKPDNLQPIDSGKQRFALLLIVGNFIAQFGTFLCVPFLAFHLASRKIGTPSSIGFVIGIGPLLLAFTGFFMGNLSDRYGSKVVLVGCAIARALSFAGFAYATSIWQFAILNAIAGAALAGIGPVSKALLAELLPTKERGIAFGRLYVTTNLAAVLGPLLGAQLSAFAYSANSTFIIGGALLLFYALVLGFKLKGLALAGGGGLTGRPGLAGTISTVIRDRWLLGYLTLLCVVSMGYSMIDSVLPQSIGSPKLYSWLLVANAFVVIIFQGGVNRILMDRPLKQALSIGIVVIAFGLAGFGFAGADRAGLFIAMGIFTIGEIFEFVTSNLILDLHAPEGLRATYFGAMSLRHVGKFIGPTAGGLVMAHAGASSSFYACSIVLLLAAGAFSYRRKSVVDLVRA